MSPGPFESLGWTQLSDGAYSTFRRHHLVTPDGRWVPRDRLHHPGAVAVLPVLGDDVVLVEQWREAVGASVWEVPAGLVEPGEHLEDAARRECVEETGFLPTRLEAVGRWWASPGISDEVVAAFVGDGLRLTERRPDGVEEEVARVVTIPASEALAAVLDGTVRDLKTASIILAAAARRGWVPTPP